MIRRHITPLVALVAVAVIGSSAACSTSDPATPPAQAAPGAGTQTKPGAQAANAVRRVDPKAFAAALKEPGVVLLDVRTPAEYAEGHLAKAINMDMEAGTFTQQVSELNTSVTYAVYCRTGRRSGVAAEQLRAAGFTKIIDLEGGIVAWTAAGNKLVTG